MRTVCRPGGRRASKRPSGPVSTGMSSAAFDTSTAPASGLRLPLVRTNPRSVTGAWGVPASATGWGASKRYSKCSRTGTGAPSTFAGEKRSPGAACRAASSSNGCRPWRSRTSATSPSSSTSSSNRTVPATGCATSASG